MKYILLFLLLFLMFSCSMYSVLPENDQPQTPQELIRWIHARVKYQDDDYLNYWRSPRETLRSGYGDCEDFCILFASMAHDLWGWKPQLQLVYLDGYWFHYFLVWDGVIYDPTCGGYVPEGEYPRKYTLICTTSYDNMMFTATAGYLKSVQGE